MGGALILLSINPAPGSSLRPADRPMLLRIDSVGTVLWQRTYGFYQNTFSAVQPLANGAYALIGGAYRPTSPGALTVATDGWLMRVTLNGDTLRSRYFGFGYDSESFTTGRATDNGGLLLTGYHIPRLPTLPSRGWLVQLDSLDQVQWQYELISAANSVYGVTIQGLEVLQGGDLLLNATYDPDGHPPLRPLPGPLAAQPRRRATLHPRLGNATTTTPM